MIRMPKGVQGRCDLSDVVGAQARRHASSAEQFFGASVPRQCGVGAFSLCATMPRRDLKEMGIGLAVAVLIDATIVRVVLMPAVMKLLGDRNWFLPRRLEWLPRFDHGTESSAQSRPAATLAVARHSR